MTDVTVLAAFGAGVISFLSPCVLPIVPGYLTVVTGADVTAEDRGSSWRIARSTVLFVLGFSAVLLRSG